MAASARPPIRPRRRGASPSRPHLCGWFGPRLGRHLVRLARFEDDRPARARARPKSESRETSFPTDVRGEAALFGPLKQLTGELGERLARQGRTGRTVSIKVRLDDFSTHTRAPRTLKQATNDPDRVGAVAAELLRRFTELLRRFSPPRPVRLLGVRVA